MNAFFMASLILAMLAIVGVFVEPPVISNYAWVMTAAYVMLAGRK